MATSPAPATKTPVFATVKFDDPIVHGEMKIDTVQLRKPSAGELRGLKMLDIVHSDVTAVTTLITRISNPVLTAVDVQMLSISDFLACADEVANFLPQKAARMDSPSE